jgi:DNA-binding GntR family transcriptional regulator
MDKLTGGLTPHQSVQDAVYAALRQNIMNLNLSPGAEISEKEIALKFDVSRTPVREAFIHLANEGLIQVFPQKKTVVALIDFSLVEQEFFIRENLELAVLELFIKKAQPQHFRELEQLIEYQSADFEHSDYLALLDHDDEFHRTFYEVAGQPLSWDVLSHTNGQYHRVRLLTIWFSGIAGDVVNQHRNILQALKNKDLSEAQQLLRGHVRKLSVEEKILRDEFPDFFVSDEKKNRFDADFGGFSLNL